MHSLFFSFSEFEQTFPQDSHRLNLSAEVFIKLVESVKSGFRDKIYGSQSLKLNLTKICFWKISRKASVIKLNKGITCIYQHIPKNVKVKEFLMVAKLLFYAPHSNELGDFSA